MRESPVEPSALPPIPPDLYSLGAASGLFGGKFFAPPTIGNLLLDRLLRSSDGVDGPASYEELLSLAHTNADDATTHEVNPSQALRYSLLRLRKLLGEDFFAQTGKPPHSTYERKESDEALARRFTPTVMKASIDHAAKWHLLATNRPVLLKFAEHLFEHYDISGPVEQQMLRSVVLLAGLPFNFKHRNPEIMRARVEAFKSIRKKLDGLRREVVYMRDGKTVTRQRVHPIGARNTIYFSRPEWLAGIEGFHSLEEIIAAHRHRFGRTLPLPFFDPQLTMRFSIPSAPAPATTRVFVGDSRFSGPQFAAANELFAGGNDSHPSTIIESRRFTTPDGRVVRRRRDVGVVNLPSSAPSPTSAPALQSPESPDHS